MPVKLKPPAGFMAPTPTKPPKVNGTHPHKNLGDYLHPKKGK